MVPETGMIPMLEPLFQGDWAPFDETLCCSAEPPAGAVPLAVLIGDPSMLHELIQRQARRWGVEGKDLRALSGRNGSGKTSLAKLLAGLYRPEQGEIRLDGEVVNDGNRDRYRQLFSAIFSDFHLFEQLLDDASPVLDEAGNQLLEKLKLHHKVKVQGGAFTTRSLSQGQRKRLGVLSRAAAGTARPGQGGSGDLA